MRRESSFSPSLRHQQHLMTPNVVIFPISQIRKLEAERLGLSVKGREGMRDPLDQLLGAALATPEQGPGRQFLVLEVGGPSGLLRGHAENRGQAVRSREGVRKQKPPIWGLPWWSSS